jgi:hypothetical protein
LIGLTGQTVCFSSISPKYGRAVGDQDRSFADGIAGKVIGPDEGTSRVAILYFIHRATPEKSWIAV